MSEWVQWIVVAAILLYMLFLVVRRFAILKPRRYTTRSQARVDQAQRIYDQVGRDRQAGTLSNADLLKYEEELQALAEQQRKEVSIHPEEMHNLRDHYVFLIDDVFRRVSDIQSTGGENLDRFEAEFEAYIETFLETSEQRN